MSFTHSLAEMVIAIFVPLAGALSTTLIGLRFVCLIESTSFIALRPYIKQLFVKLTSPCRLGLECSFTQLVILHPPPLRVRLVDPTEFATGLSLLQPSDCRLRHVHNFATVYLLLRSQGDRTAD